jgi:hypothetical protein
MKKKYLTLLNFSHRVYITLLLLLIGIFTTNAQVETEPNDAPTDSGVISMGATTQIYGTSSGADVTDYWKFSRSPFATGTINMSIQSGIGNAQVGMTLEKRSGSYSGAIVSEVVINNGENASNQAFSLDYSGDFYYLLKPSGVGTYNYKINFPSCNVTSSVTSIITTVTPTSLLLNNILGTNANVYVVKINTIDSFTDPTEGTNYPTVDGTAYNGLGEQTVYVGNSVTPNVTITGLSLATTYFIKVFGYADCAGSLRLDTGTTFTKNTCGIAPSTATAMDVISISNTIAKINSITGNTDTTTQFVVKVNTANTFTAPTNGALPTANTAYLGGEQVVYAGNSATPNIEVTGLLEGTEHFFKVYSSDLCDSTNYFETTGFSTSVTPICSGPTSNAGILLETNVITHNTIRVSNWTGANNADGKIIYISDQNNFNLPTTVSFFDIPTASLDYAGKTGQQAIYTGANDGFSVIPTGLTPGTTYYFAAVNYKFCNGSLYFFPAAAYTQRATCGASVTDFTSNAIFNNIDATTLDLTSFTAPAFAVDGYIIKMNTTNSFTSLAMGDAIPSSGNTAYGGGEQIMYSGNAINPNLSITGLTENTEYFFSITTHKTCGAVITHQETGYTFSQKTNGINFTQPTIAFGDAATALNVTTTSTGAISYSLINDITGATLTGNMFTPSNAGTTTLRVEVTADGMYNALSKDFTLAINKQAPVLAWGNQATIERNIPIDAARLNATSDLAGTFAYSTPGGGLITPGVTGLSAIGTNVLTATFTPSNTTNYAIGTVTANIEVTKTNITITANDVITAVGVSEGLTYTITQGAFASGETVYVPLVRAAGETAGDYAITVDSSALPSVNASGDPCTGGICINNFYDLFGDGSFVTGNNLTALYNITFIPGTYTISSKTAVTLTFDPASIAAVDYDGNQHVAITLSSIMETATGNIATPTPVITYTYVNSGGSSYGPTTIPPTNAGSYNVTAKVDDTDPNFIGSATTLFITNFTQITAFSFENLYPIFDGTPKPITVVATPITVGNVFQPTYAGINGTSYAASTTPPSAIGEYQVSINNGLNSIDGNYFYTGATVAQNMTITAKRPLSIVLNTADLNVEYDTTSKQVGISSVVDLISGNTLDPSNWPTINVTYDGSTTAPINATTTDVSVIATVAVNDATYEGNSTRTMSIYGATPTIVVPDETVVFDGTPKISSATISGVSGDPVTLGLDIQYAPEFTSNYSVTPPTALGRYFVRAQYFDGMVGSYSPNYINATKLGTITIVNKKPVTITLTPADLTATYDGTVKAVTVASIVETNGGATANPTPTVNILYEGVNGTVYTSSNTAPINAGAYKVTATVAASDANYIGNATETLVIGQVPLTITVDANQQKVYGENDPATFTYQITSGSLLNGDTLTGGLARATGQNKGSYAINQGTLVAPSNYAITFQSSNFEIQKAKLVVSPVAANEVFGVTDLPADGATSNYGYVVTGFVNGDDATDLNLVVDSSDVQIVNTTNPGQPLDVGTYPTALTWVTSPILQSISGNYDVLGNGTGSITINPAQVTVTAEAKTKTYDADTNTDAALTYIVDRSNLTTGANIVAYPNPLVFTGNLTRTGDQNAGIHPIQQGTLSLGTNYVINYVGADFTINKVALTATSTSTKVYGDALGVLPVQYTGFIGSDDASVIDTAPTVIPAVTIDETTTVGTYVVNISGGLDTNYTITPTNGSIEVTKKALLATIEAKTKVYGEANPTFTLVYSGFVNGDTESAITQAIIFGAYESGVTLVSETTGIGEYFITNLPGTFVADNYFIQITNLGVPKLIITKRVIEVTADAKTKIYGEADPALTYQISTGSLAGSDVFTGSLTRVSGKNIGTYAIEQNDLALNANYTLTYIGNNLTIEKRPLNYTWEPITMVYGDDVSTPVLVVNSGSVAPGDNVFFKNIGQTLFRRFSQFSGIGSHSVSPYMFDNVNGVSFRDADDNPVQNNYDVTGSSPNVPITFTARPITVAANALQSKAYGAAEPMLTYTVTSGNMISTGFRVDALAGSLERVAGENVGMYAINQGTLANANYNITYENENFEITKATASINLSGLTHTYDAKAKAAVATTTPAGLSVDFTYEGINGTTYAVSATAPTNGGEYQVTGVINEQNYQGNTTGTLVISKIAQVITFNGIADKTYGATDFNLGATTTSNLVVAYASSNTAVATISGNTVTVVGVGNTTITASQVGNVNYNVATNVAQVLKVLPRAIEITADAKTKIYGDVDPTFTYTITNGSLVGSDVFTGSLTRVSGKNIGTYAIQQNDLALNANYALTYVGNNLTIEKRPLNYTWQPITSVYGDDISTPVLVINSGSVAPGDTVFINVDQNHFRIVAQQLGIGSHSPTPFFFDGANGVRFRDTNNFSVGNNYDVTGSSSDVPVTLTARPITVTAVASQSKVYGDIEPTLTYTVTSGNLISTSFRIDALAGSLERAIGENVGMYAINQGTLANANYDITYEGDNFNITKKNIQVTADVKSKTYGDADPALTYTITNGSLVNGDVLSGNLIRVTGENVGVYTINQGTVVLNANYTLAYASNNLTITAGSNQVIWDGSTNSDWSVGTNWSNNATPLTTHDVLIPNVGTTPVISGGITAQVKSLIINTSSEFNIASDGGVIVVTNFDNNGTTTITSNASSSGAFIVKGTSNGVVSYERGGLLANKWSIISAPVHGQSIKEFVENPINNIRVNTTTTPHRYAVSYYDDSNAAGSKWVYYTVDDLTTNNITFEKGRSYAISRGTDGTVTFTGTLETINVTKTITASEWNAVGNPYTAFLPINENAGTNFINDNLSKFNPVNVGVYVWDNAQGKYVGKSLVTGESSLAPGQGFFVKTTTGVSDIVFDQSQRKVQPLTGGTFNRGRGKTSPSIQLLATLNGVTVDTSIKYFDNATKGLDPGYDLGNYAKSKFDVYTRLLNDEEGQDYTIQSLPTDDIETTIMPLGIKASSGDKINFTVSTKDLPEGVEVFIEDKKLSTFTKLNVDTNEDYSVKITEMVNGVGRFYLHTKTNKLPVDVLHIDEIEIYTIDKNTLRVDGFTTGNFKLKLYNILGASVLEKAVEAKGKNLVNLPDLQTGVYIVRIDSDLGVKTKKIMIK